MYEIKNTILGICIALLLIGFFLKLSPKGNLTNGMKYLLSLIVMLIILAPLKGGFRIELDNFNLNQYTPETTKKSYEERVVNNVVTMMKKDIEEYMTQEKFGFYSVLINTIDTDEGTEVREIVIKIKSGYDPSKVEKAVSKKFGLPCRVTIGTG